VKQDGEPIMGTSNPEHLKFFSYLEFHGWGGVGFLSAYETRGFSSPEEVGRSIEYLSSGTGIVAAPVIEFDPQDCDADVGSPRLLTDGVWAWNSLVVYYLNKLRSAIPLALVTHMQRNQWQCPTVSDSRLKELRKVSRRARGLVPQK
jgi:hypothetical protein